MLLFIAYFGVAFAGFDVPPTRLAAAGAFSLYSGGFSWRHLAWRHPGRREANNGRDAAALGLGWWRTLQRQVIVPQALADRRSRPRWDSSCNLVKNTALASVIGYIELTRAGPDRVEFDLSAAARCFLTVAAMYFVICFTLSLVSRQLESRVPQIGPIPLSNKEEPMPTG